MRKAHGVRRNQCAGDFLTSENQRLPCNLSRCSALRGAAVFLCPYISPHGEASHYLSCHCHKLSTHTEVVSVSALWCINYATSASNSPFFSSLQGNNYYNLMQVIIILVFRQMVGFSCYFVQPGATCALSTCICGRAIFQKNIAGACLHTLSCPWQTLLFT